MFYNTLHSKSGGPWDTKWAGHFQSPSAHRDTHRHVPGTAFLSCEGRLTGMLGGPLLLTPVCDEKLTLSNPCVLAASTFTCFTHLAGSFFFLLCVWLPVCTHGEAYPCMCTQRLKEDIDYPLCLLSAFSP